MLNVTLERVESQNCKVVVIEDTQLNDPIYWIPFQKQSINGFFVLNDHEVLALSETALLVVYCTSTGQQVRELKVDAINTRYAYCSRDKTRLYLFGYHSLTIIDTLTLSVVLQANGFDMRAEHPRLAPGSERSFGKGDWEELQIKPPMTELTDGRLMVATDASRGYGFMKIDPTSFDFERVILSETFNVYDDPLPEWFSPSGQYVCRRSSGDYRNKVKQGLELEIWDITREPRLILKVPAGNDEVINDVLWEEGEAAFWVLSGSHVVQRVPLNDRPGPKYYVERWASEDDPLRLEKSLKFYQNSYTKRSLSLTDHNVLKIMNELLGSAELRFAEPMAQSSLWNRMMTKLKTAKDVKVISVDEDNHVEPKSKEPNKAAVAYAEAKTSVPVPLSDFEESTIRTAFHALGEKLSGGLYEFIWHDQLKLSFHIGKKKISEEKFFEKLVAEDRTELADDISKLIQQYLVGVEKNVGAVPWASVAKGIPSLQTALNALLRLDPSQLGTFKSYLRKQDGEHDLATIDVTFASFVKQNTWHLPRLPRIGVFVALYSLAYGRSISEHVWDHFGLITWARQNIDPEEFAEIVSSEISAFHANDQWNHTTPDYFLKSISSALDNKLEFAERFLRAVTTPRQH